MYTVFANNHFHNVNFEQSFLEYKLAEMVFKTACKCEDCETAMIMNALTGELVAEYDYVNGITTY